MKKSIIFLAFFGIAIVFAQQITTLAEYKSSIKVNKAEAKNQFLLIYMMVIKQHTLIIKHTSKLKN